MGGVAKRILTVHQTIRLVLAVLLLSNLGALVHVFFLEWLVD